MPACRCGRAVPGSVEHGLGELGPGADADLAEDLLQVVLDGVRADVQLPCHLPVGGAFGDQPGYLSLLRCQLVGGDSGALAGPLTGRLQLHLGAPGECFHAPLVEEVTGSAQMFTRVAATALPAQPLAVDEVGAGAVYR